MKKIYVMCPAYIATGGTELLHQLVFKLRNLCFIEAYLYYINIDWRFEIFPTPKRFEHYIGENWKEKVEDAKNNILIIPETYANKAFNYHNITIYIWWLSVDNFFPMHGLGYNDFKNPNFKAIIKRLLNKHPISVLKKLVARGNVKLHLCQSEYAWCFLGSFKIFKRKMLSDYISFNLIDKNSADIINRKDYVLYNPKKGIETTNKIIEEAPNFNWFPLEKLTSSEISSIMATSKVYIDFGPHPGKDRIPREAALNGCCILTNMEGAAKNDKDVLIPKKYKFSDPHENIIEIVKTINNIIHNYQDLFSDFDEYRNSIKNEEMIFEKQLINIFNH